MTIQLAKLAGLIFIAFVLVHWLTAGQDEIIQGPPVDVSSYTSTSN